jgi:predicted lipid-binding transport protein (Tim44 family)
MDERKSGFIKPAVEPVKPVGNPSLFGQPDRKYPALHEWLSRQPEARHQQNWGILGGIYGGLFGGIGGGGTGALAGSGQIAAEEWPILLLPILVATILSIIATVFIVRRGPANVANKPVWKLYQASYTTRVDSYLGEPAAKALEQVAGEVVALEQTLNHECWLNLPANSPWSGVREDVLRDLRTTMEALVERAAVTHSAPSDLDATLQELAQLRQEVEKRTESLLKREGGTGHTLRDNLERMRAISRAEDELDDSLREQR